MPSTALPPAASAMPRSRLARGVLCGLSFALIWAGWAVATRFAVKTSLAPQDVTFLRFGVSAVLLLPVLVHQGFGFGQVSLGRLAWMVAGAGCPFMLLASTGMRFAPASHVATLMMGMTPIWVAVLSGLLFKERFGRLQVWGMGASAAGVLCIGGHALLAHRASGEWIGDLMFLVAGFLYAIYTLAMRRSGLNPWHSVALVNVYSALLFAPVYFLFLKPQLMAAPLSDVLFQAVAQGVGIAIAGMFFFTQTVWLLGASRAAFFASLVPALAALIGAVALGEIPTTATLAGVVLATCGIGFVLMGGTRTPVGR